MLKTAKKGTEKKKKLCKKCERRIKNMLQVENVYGKKQQSLQHSFYFYKNQLRSFG